MERAEFLGQDVGWIKGKRLIFLVAAEFMIRSDRVKWFTRG